MKREFLSRAASSSALFLVIWSCMANSVMDDLTKPIMVLCAVMMLHSCAVGLYFVPFIQGRLPMRYRIIPTLDPVNFALPSNNDAAARLGALRVSSTSRQSAHLAKLNVRKVEAMKAAGLLRQASNPVSRADSLEQSLGAASIRRQGSNAVDGGSSGMAGAAAYSAQNLMMGSNQRMLHQRLGFGHSASREEERAGPTNGYSVWTSVVKTRRVVDPVCAVRDLETRVITGRTPASRQETSVTGL